MALTSLACGVFCLNRDRICPLRSTVAARKCVPPRSAAKIRFESVLSAARISLPDHLRCLDVSSLLNTHSQPNKLRHGPRERCGRSRSRAETKTRRWAIQSIPNLFWNHQTVVREGSQRIQSLPRRSNVAGGQFIFTAFASQQGPKTPFTISAIVVFAGRSFTVSVLIVAIPSVTRGRFNFY